MSKKRKRKNNNKKYNQNRRLVRNFDVNNDTSNIDISDNPVKNTEVEEESPLKDELANELLETPTPKSKDVRNILFKNKGKSILIGSLVILTMGSGSLIYLHGLKNNNLSFNGIYIDSEHVGKLNKEQLSNKISNLLNNKIENSKIEISYNDEIITVMASELSIRYDIESIVDNILSYKKSSSSLANSFTQLFLNLNNHEVGYSPIIDNEKLDEFVNSIYKKTYIQPVNAKISPSETNFKIESEQIGTELDKSSLKSDLLLAINSNFNENKIISLSFKEIQPTLNKDLAEKFEVLGTYETKLPQKTGSRTENIKLFTRKLNNAVIKVGEEFSCDSYGGDREWSDGYRSAPGYINGEVKPILAGGICQATSTIYNALLYADLEITERHPHSLTVKYAPLGLDAAIAKGVKDLKFINNTDNPIVLQTYVTSDGYVKASILGIPSEKNKSIKLFTKVFSSKSADAYKETYINGQLNSTELLSSDRYK